jgi:hypothetical protein
MPAISFPLNGSSISSILVLLQMYSNYVCITYILCSLEYISYGILL